MRFSNSVFLSSHEKSLNTCSASILNTRTMWGGSSAASRLTTASAKRVTSSNPCPAAVRQ